MECIKNPLLLRWIFLQIEKSIDWENIHKNCIRINLTLNQWKENREQEK